MIQQFENLTTEEAEKMINAIPLITILIAGADDNIDNKEKEWAIKIAKVRTYSNPELLHDYYVEVGKDFAEKLEEYINRFSKITQERTGQISNELKQLNAIFPKLDPVYAAKLYRSFLSFAKHVAKASGGFMGFGSISSAESHLIGLPMLTPVLPPDSDEN